MPHIQVSSSGSRFFYLDSGKPENEDYTTIVMVHGTTFHSGTFKRLFPFAPGKKLRLICPNRRDYQGTTLYSDKELAQLQQGNEEELRDFFRNRGREWAGFLDGLINELQIPKPLETSSGNSGHGGLVLLGWSLGALEPLLLLGQFEGIPQDVKKRLDSYLKAVILFDPSPWTIGLDVPQGVSFILDDESIPVAERPARFSKWVSSYFNHKDLGGRDPATLEFTIQDPGRRNTVGTLSPEELAELTDRTPLGRSERGALRPEAKNLIRSNAERVVTSMQVKDAWANVDIWYITGTRSSGLAWYATWQVKKWKEEGDGVKVNFAVIEDANHFAFFDEPEKFMNVVEGCIMKGG
ncbi:hypothetical protein M422DRAFT_779668 [Sphaerobolus stellatus SS14]|uniref:AB hydrolase-1 domain-containing protein n=1 Tax=Sphaerobolus stellatus (strain SS14) TaxID=990650 RepID=A0A0C9ULC2_SPHS4|nr:hypothetical protein M422DRAFT_779668 [Sphaerobolus stellatus SS14]